ncbi:MAG: AAA family ATPase [Richelia sp. CSU_2_1]|nr:AAA family ATPase [Microcoleus sp. SU_5_3]NJL68084.1 AAA family ATPase [Microcoleus sp. SM1_3_4]NJR26684.1 AAA family ATPase [Richelia sp. CSU_2_1]
MLKQLCIEQFKSFKEAELTLGPLTILVGTNASGKSNIRDAFRFLHGISRGYNLAEIMGEKYVEGGVIQWRGIRGGVREITFRGENTFSLTASFVIKKGTSEESATYCIKVDSGIDNHPPSLISERLSIGDRLNFLEAKSLPTTGREQVIVKILNHQITNRPIPFSRYQSIIYQLAELATDIAVEGESNAYIAATSIKGIARATLNAFSSMRFLDLSPEAMRMPSIPGQTILGDRGENLSSVLLDICQIPEKKEALLQWMQELTPMDAKDFEFPTDFTGKVLLTLVEGSGQKISAYSASDGTLRFLAIVAAMLGSDPAQFYFIEELENGIHPARLHLLLQLIERKVSEGNIQMVATTHSSTLLKLLSAQTLESASLTYRLEDKPDAKIIRILDIPDAARIIKEQNLGRLHESAWLENVMEFLKDDGEAE